LKTECVGASESQANKSVFKYQHLANSLICLNIKSLQVRRSFYRSNLMVISINECSIKVSSALPTRQTPSSCEESFRYCVKLCFTTSRVVSWMGIPWPGTLRVMICDLGFSHQCCDTCIQA